MGYLGWQLAMMRGTRRVLGACPGRAGQAYYAIRPSSTDNPAVKHGPGLRRSNEKKTTLADLPNELLFEIFNYFSWDCRGVLSCICLTCHRMYAIAQPLRDNIIMYLDGPKGLSYVFNAVIDPHASCNLDIRVEEVQIQKPLQPPGKMQALSESVATKAKEALDTKRRADPSFAEPVYEELSKALDQGDRGAQIALAVMCLPRLKYLAICCSGELLANCEWTLRVAFKVPDAFANVKKIVIDSCYRYHPDRAGYLVRLPKLEELMLTQASDSNLSVPCKFDWDPGMFDWGLVKGTSNIKTINLNHATMANRTIEHVLQACKAPTVFSYTWGHDHSIDSVDQLTDFMSVLRSCRDSLEKVKIDMLGAFKATRSSRSEKYFQPIGSFMDFGVLRELEIPGYLLVGLASEPSIDILPRSLSRLTLECVGPERSLDFILPFLDKFADGCARRLPRLKLVTLVVFVRDGPWLESIVANLEAQGINVIVKSFAKIRWYGETSITSVPRFLWT